MILFLEKLFFPSRIERKLKLLEKLYLTMKLSFGKDGELKYPGMCFYIDHICSSLAARRGDEEILLKLIRKHRPKDAYYRDNMFIKGLYWYKPYVAKPRLEFLQGLIKKYQPLYKRKSETLI